jgi:hypothetical protein
MKNTIDMEKHIEMCQEYEKKINDLYSKLSKLRENYNDLKEEGEYFDYKDISKIYKWIKILFSTNKKLYTSMVIHGLYMENCYARENIHTQEKAILDLDCMFFRISENYKELVIEEGTEGNENNENGNS